MPRRVLGITAAALIAAGVGSPGIALGSAETTAGEASPAGLIDARSARAASRRSPEVEKRRRESRLRPVERFFPGINRWQVGWLDAGGREVVRTDIDARSGRLIGSWTGHEVVWARARGEWTPFKRRILPAVLVACVLFVLPFVDPRRPFRLLHLDLLAIVSLTGSLAALFSGHLGLSVGLMYPPLLYLAGRAAWTGFRPRPRAGPLIPVLSDRALLAGILLLLAGRVVFYLLAGRVSDVGYAGVFGANSIREGFPLYSNHPVHLDTYGPVNYALYLPFELVWPMDAALSRAHVGAARAATIAFDLAAVGAIAALGRSLRPGADGRTLGLALAWAWLALPFGLLAYADSTNDALPAIAVVVLLLLAARPLARGAALALGSATKFATLPLAPLFARGTGDGMRRQAGYAVVAAAAFAIVFAPHVLQSGLRVVWDSTLGFQLGRASPFTAWGLEPSLEWLQAIAKGAAVGVAALVAFVPGRRSIAQLAALAALVTILFQLAGGYWTHTYVVWFAPALLAALFAGYTRVGSSSPADTGLAGERVARARSSAVTFRGW